MVTLDNLTVSYRQHPALHHISGQFVSASMTAVIGPNGSGKSTLLKTIVGQLRAGAGKVAVSAQPARVAYLPQLSEIERAFPLDVRDCVALGCWPARGAWGGLGAAQINQVDSALAEVGLEGFEHRPIDSLSSGQLQRVLFARLMVQDAELILLDEPFNAIDSKTAAALMGLVKTWHGQQRTVIAVLHDDQQVREHFPQTLLLAREQVAWGPTAEVLTDANLARARAMAEAWDDEAAFCAIDERRQPMHKARA